MVNQPIIAVLSSVFGMAYQPFFAMLGIVCLMQIAEFVVLDRQADSLN
jgi:hypothetical protein